MLTIAHRGASYSRPENTIPAFLEAWEVGADVVEFDVRRARDGLAVIHDATVDRTTNGTGRVSDFTIEELSCLDAGDRAGVPSLELVLVACRGRIMVNIELKEEEIAAEVLDMIRTYGFIDSAIISAFDVAPGEVVEESTSTWADLLWMKCKEPRIKISPLARTYEDMIRALDVARDHPLYAINLHASLIGEHALRAAHERGVLVWAWTVDELAKIRWMKMRGVDGIISNVPHLLLDRQG